MDITQHKHKIVRYTLEQQIEIFHFGKVEVWKGACCYGDIITTITMCSTSTLQNLNRVDLVFAAIFHILLFYIILSAL